MFIKPQFFPMGERALVVELGHRIDVNLSCEIAALARRLRASAPAGVTDIVPAYTTLTLHYDPAIIGAEPYDVMVAAVAERLLEENDEPQVTGRHVEIPVCYGGRYGQDLESLAASIRLGMEEVIRIHSQVCYRVHMLGFVPGFAYLGGLDARIAVPRHVTPRSRVPAGSVAIGGGQPCLGGDHGVRAHHRRRAHRRDQEVARAHPLSDEVGRRRGRSGVVALTACFV